MNTVYSRRVVLLAAAVLAVTTGRNGLVIRAQQAQKITINYPTRSGASWPLYSPRKAATTRSTVSTSICSSACTRPASRC